LSLGPGSGSGGASSEGTRYCSSIHLPRSISLHRSEQKGRQGLFSNSAPLPQTGHFTFINLLKYHGQECLQSIRKTNSKSQSNSLHNVINKIGPLTLFVYRPDIQGSVRVNISDRDYLKMIITHKWHNPFRQFYGNRDNRRFKRFIWGKKVSIPSMCALGLPC